MDRQRESGVGKKKYAVVRASSKGYKRESSTVKDLVLHKHWFVFKETS